MNRSSGTNITAGHNSATGVLSLTGNDTSANYQAFCEPLPTTTARLIKFTANDGIDQGPLATTTLTVELLNRPPVADDDAVGVNEDDGVAGVTATQLAGDTELSF